MKHAKRMIVISEEEYMQLKARKKARLFKKAAKYKQSFLKKTKHQTDPGGAAIEQYFTPDHQSRVKAILKDLERSGIKIKENREFQLPYGDTVSGSDIVSLVKELLVGSRLSEPKPTGWKEFVKAVAGSETPLAMISKTPARNLIKKEREESLIWEQY